MKHISAVLLLLALGIAPAVAQNMPDGATGPTGGSAAIALPDDYNSGSNTASSLFNFTRTWVPSRAATTFTLPVNAAFTRTITTYTNGFGQPLQTNVDLDRDLVTVYDNRTMLDKPAYLPFAHTTRGAGFRVNGFTEQKAWYDSHYSAEGDNAYSHTAAVANGSQHSTASYAPGAGQTGSSRGTTISAEVNTLNDQIPILEDVPGNIPTRFNWYQDGNLIVARAEGQHDALTYEYRNRSGQLICKKTDAGDGTTRFLKTYYVYNTIGKVTWVIPPKAAAALEALSWSGSAQVAVYNGLCYHYTYNEYGQLIEKTAPDREGADVTVYDSRHRPVLSQTPLLKDRNQWAFQLYDSRSRIVCSGFVTGGSAATRSRQDWQDIANSSTAYTAGSLEDYVQHGCPSNFNLPYAIADCQINQYSYYDTYSFESSLPFVGRAYSTLHNADFAAGDFYVTPQPVSFARGLLTATRTRTLVPAGTTNPFAGEWTNTLIFYDLEGRPIQTQTQYPWTGNGAWDVASTQYTFRGQVARTVLTHQVLSSTANAVSKVLVVRAWEPGGLGRLKSVTMTLNGGTPVQLSLYDYDELGRVKLKDIGGGTEKQNYTYNIRGQLTGINAGYVTNPAWPDATFGCALSYDYGFTEARFDGAIAGMRWRGAGSASAPRAYGYRYDRAGRMTAAEFNVCNTASPLPVGASLWGHTALDYSVSGITYDDNGNMLTLNQQGMVSGVSTPQTIDNLDYQYRPNSNRLDRVEDNPGVAAGINSGWGLGDFVNGNNGSADYEYDKDGNLALDRNKGVSSIIYNAQDLPTDVVSGNGEVHNIYDAAGTLLQKSVTENGNVTLYNYCGPYVYKDRELSYMLHEEGRARWDRGAGVWHQEFFVKDHLGNVRTVVGKEQGPVVNYLATHEVQNAPLERQLFSLGEEGQKQSSTNSGDVTAVNLDGSDPDLRIGTSLMLKVMAGDKFQVQTDAYYDGEAASTGEDCSTGTVLGALAGALSGGITSLGTAEGLDGYGVETMLGSTNTGDGYDRLLSNNTDPAHPQAFLNWLFFDGDMNLVESGSGARQVGMDQKGQWGTLSSNGDIVAGSNGYLVVFMSNSTGRLVQMDNLKVTYSRGQLLEEQHYYPHGLVVKGGTLNPLPNRFLYQGKELQEEADLQLYDFHARQYDPQIGRFWGVDPADQFPSGYTGMGNDPANGTDPTGCVFEGGSIGAPISGASNPVSRTGFETIHNPGLYSRFNAQFAMTEDGYLVKLNWSADGRGGGDGVSSAGESNVKNIETVYQGSELTGFRITWTTGSSGPDGFVLTSHSKFIKAAEVMGMLSGQGGMGRVQNNEVNAPWIKTLNDVYGNGTFLTGTALSIIDTKPGKLLSIGGSYVYKASTYSAQRGLVSELAYGSKALKGTGYVFGSLGVGITIADMAVNGVTTSNSLDLVMGGISFIPGWGWVAGGIYFIGNAVIKANTGKDLGEHIDDWTK